MNDLRPPLEGYSLWLEPAGSEGKQFEQCTRDLAATYAGVYCVPHVTLLGLLDWRRERVEEARTRTEELAKSIAPFRVEFTGIGTRNLFFQSLFLQAVPSPELVHLNATARKLFGHEGDPPFMPHASLYYGNLSHETKKRIIADLGFHYPVTQHVASVSLVDVYGYPDEWHAIQRLPLTSA